jgi:hypothetical protein
MERSLWWKGRHISFSNLTEQSMRVQIPPATFNFGYPSEERLEHTQTTQ